MEENKKNAVKLSLEDYLRLYEFRKNFENENQMVCRTEYTYNIPSHINSNMIVRISADQYITDDDAIKDILKKNEELAKHARLLKEQIKEYEESYRKVLEKNRVLNNMLENPKVEGFTIQDVKKMSILQFIKWRKK